MIEHRVRLRDVAGHAEVSPATASAVLTGRHVEARIAVATQERVRAAAVELGDRPNLAARAVRTNRSRVVGLLSDSIAAERYAGDVVRGVMAAALVHDHLLVIAKTGGDRHVEDDLVRGMTDRRIDGLLNGAMFTRTVELSALVREVPVVLLNCLTDPLPGPAVVPDEVMGGREAARGLLEAGHGRASTSSACSPRRLPRRASARSGSMRSSRRRAWRSPAPSTATGQHPTRCTRR